MVALQEDNNADCLAASDACNGELSAFSVVISRCFPLYPSREGAGPFATCQPAISELPPYIFPSPPVFLFLTALSTQRLL